MTVELRGFDDLKSIGLFRSVALGMGTTAPGAVFFAGPGVFAVSRSSLLSWSLTDCGLVTVFVGAMYGDRCLGAAFRSCLSPAIAADVTPMSKVKTSTIPFIHTSLENAITPR